MLVWLLAVSLIGGFVVLALPERTAKPAAAVVAAIVVALYGFLLAGVPAGVNWPWIGVWGIRFHLGADGLSLFLLGLTTVMTLVAILASRQEQGRSYFFWLLFLEFGGLGLFAALDLFLFYIFWEVVLIPVFFLLTGWSGPRGSKAALKWLVMNLAGSLFMLVGIIAVGVIHAQHSGVMTFELNALHGTPLGGSAPWIFVAFFLAFAIKAPLWPFHGWMPEAYGEAPAPVTAIIAGVLSKAGVYGILRVMLPLFGAQFKDYQTGLLLLAAIGLVYGALIALRQRDMKLTVAYASMSHLGMIALGIFSLSQAGIVGATYLMVAHGVMVGGLFVVLGRLEERTGGERDLAVLAGLNRGMPRMAAYFLFFALATLGLPGLPGFAGEYMVIQGLIPHEIGFAIVAGIVLIVAAWYMLRLFQGVMQGPSRHPVAAVDLRFWEVFGLVPFAGLVLLLGIWPAGITAHTATSLYHAVHLLAGGGGIG